MSKLELLLTMLYFPLFAVFNLMFKKTKKIPKVQNLEFKILY